MRRQRHGDASFARTALQPGSLILGGKDSSDERSATDSRAAGKVDLELSLHWVMGSGLLFLFIVGDSLGIGIRHPPLQL